MTALDISRVTFQRIRLNLFFSLAYNALGIPVAAGHGPTLAAFFQLKLFVAVCCRVSPFVAVCRRLSPFVAIRCRLLPFVSEPTEGIPLHNSNTL